MKTATLSGEATHFVEVWRSNNRKYTAGIRAIDNFKIAKIATVYAGGKTLQIWHIKFKDAANPQHSDTYLNYMSSLTSGALNS